MTLARRSQSRSFPPRRATDPVGHGRTLLLLVLATMACVLVGGASANAQNASSAAKPVSLTTNFTRVGSGQLMGDDRYVLVYRSSKGTLIDPRTGERTKVSEPGCIPDVLGGTSIVFICHPSAKPAYFGLYTISSQGCQALLGGLMNCRLTASPVVYSSRCMDSVSPEDSAVACAGLTAIGDDWVAFAPPCGQQNCGLYNYVFQYVSYSAGYINELRPPGRTTTVDINTRLLQRTLCKPLTVPATTNPGATPFPAVTFDGRFAIATSHAGNYLEECGTHLHQFLTATTSPDLYPSCWSGACAPPSTSHAIIWQTAPASTNPHRQRSLSGIFLPSRRRFTIQVPAKVGPLHKGSHGHAFTLVLTPRTLYLTPDSPGGSVWSTPIPAAPPKPNVRHAT